MSCCVCHGRRVNRTLVGCWNVRDMWLWKQHNVLRCHFGWNSVHGLMKPGMVMCFMVVMVVLVVVLLLMMVLGHCHGEVEVD